MPPLAPQPSPGVSAELHPVVAGCAVREAWWDAQRERAATARLSLGHTSSRKEKTFEYLLQTRLDLSSRPENVGPRSERREVRIEGAGPLPELVQQDSPEPLAWAPSPAILPHKPQKPSEIPSVRLPTPGAVAQRLHPHHPIHTDAHLSRRAEAWNPSTAVPSMHGQSPPPPRRNARGEEAATRSPPPPIPEEEGSLTQVNQLLKARRRPRSSQGAPLSAHSPKSTQRHSDRQAATARRPAWSSPTSHPSLFDKSLCTRTLRDDERADRAQHAARGAAKGRERGEAAGRLQPELEHHLARIQAQLEHDYPGVEQESPFYLACTRRLARLSAEMKVLKQPGALHHHGVRLTRLLLMQELRKLARDVRAGDISLDQVSSGGRRRAPPVADRSSATAHSPYEGSVHVSRVGASEDHRERGCSAGRSKEWRKVSLSVCTPDSENMRSEARTIASTDMRTPNDSARRSPSPESRGSKSTAHDVPASPGMRQWLEGQLDRFAQRASDTQEEIDQRFRDQQRMITDLIASVGGASCGGPAPAPSLGRAYANSSDWESEMGCAYSAMQVEHQTDARKRIELQAALQMLAQVDQERDEVRKRWFSGEGHAVRAEMLARGMGDAEQPASARSCAHSTYTHEQAWSSREPTREFSNDRSCQPGVVWGAEAPVDSPTSKAASAPQRCASDACGPCRCDGAGESKRGSTSETTIFGESMDGGATARKVKHGASSAMAQQRIYQANTCSLSKAIQVSIWQAKREYEMSLERSAVPEPWSLIEQLSEEILEGVLQGCAEGLFNACNDAVDMVADAEFTREAGTGPV